MTDPALTDAVARLRDLGVTRIESFAWRDLDDPDAGGSEIHADEIFRRWAEAGLEIVHRTSVLGDPRAFDRHGYHVVQRGGRLSVFARVAGRQVCRRRPSGTVTIEIWNGMPWFGPVWAPRRRVVWLHHVHAEMWDSSLKWPLNVIGRTIEGRVAPLLYRRNPVATLSDSSAEEIVELGLHAERLTIIPPGVHERFVPSPDGRAGHPVALVVGRLSPVKRHIEVLSSLRRVRERFPDFEVRIAGDGPSRPQIEEWIAANDAADWVTLLGRIDDDALVDEYQHAWVVVSGSHAEGWGMSITEGAACGTPSVATDIPGHRDALAHDVTGLLVDDVDGLDVAVGRLLDDPDLHSRLADAAFERARRLSWNSVAARHLELVIDAVSGDAG